MKEKGRGKDVMNQNYKDLDGNSRSFTVVDHDVKPTIRTDKPLSEDEVTLLKKSVNDNKQRQIEEILALPPIAFIKTGNAFVDDFVIRDFEKERVFWNEQVVKDALSINNDLRQAVLNLTWKNTVKEQYWFDDMSHEDIIAGKWRELM